MSDARPKILLLQARAAGDANADHELACFAERCELPREAFRALNLAVDEADRAVLSGHDAVMVGGAGDFSLVAGGFGWHEALLELMRAIVSREMPMFASCFGFQALIQALGGQIESRPEMAELGTHRVRLTASGEQDPLFGVLPESFDAQFGHNDSATKLPDEMELLASSERCRNQAVRVSGLPIVATQFHPELTWRDNARRYKTYLCHYEADSISEAEASRRALAMHRPSPRANELLRKFIALYLEKK